MFNSYRSRSKSIEISMSNYSVCAIEVHCSLYRPSELISLTFSISPLSIHDIHRDKASRDGLLQQLQHRVPFIQPPLPSSTLFSSLGGFSPPRRIIYPHVSFTFNISSFRFRPHSRWKEERYRVKAIPPSPEDYESLILEIE